jgi:hypothetical protein
MNQIRRNLFRAGVAAVTWAAAQGFATSRAAAQRVDQQNVGCFRRGTNILTPKGKRPIEYLRRGDLLQTISGLACIEEMVSYRADEPLVMLRAGALAPQQPDRDLTLTEHHAVLLDGVLIAVGLLINGTSILRVGGDTLPEVFNIRLPAGHGVIYAHNTPVETFYDVRTESSCLTRYGYRSRYREMQGYLRSAWAPICDRRNPVDRIRDRLDEYSRRREQNDSEEPITPTASIPVPMVVPSSTALCR